MPAEPAGGTHLPDPGQAVYGISVAADLAGIGVQTLRLYERHGLVRPARSDGGTRRYSGDDLARLHRITTLAAAGINLAGIGRILDLEDANADLHSDNDRLRTDNAALRANNRRRTEPSG
ncbi:MerR family transcriptional regulator [Nocardia sp. CS682]|uniref:MerR family transcriptional regulator n=1 Tax=Nocardia sp. CS682 TaxID=1047172 RepID=UPI0010752431|nr:MerR family transcriptional regulator [Nocardia sp. CS682]QBS41290.1 MerR family transcriptional regulator [Nocardia sp. CS682]